MSGDVFLNLTKQKCSDIWGENSGRSPVPVAHNPQTKEASQVNEDKPHMGTGPCGGQM